MSFNKDTGFWEGYIYSLTNGITNKQYVGQTTTTVEKRWKEHKLKMYSGNSVYLYYAMRKYGANNFTVEKVYSYKHKNRMLLIKHLNEKEKHFIKKYNTLSPHGYNLTKGGDSKPSGFGNAAKPVCQYDFECRYIDEYESISMASKIVGISVSSIVTCCTKKNTRAGNFIWRYKTDSPPTERIFHKTNRIKEFDLNGNLIKIWNSIDEAATNEDSLFAVDYIRRCARGNIMSHNNKVWRLIDDDFDKYRTPKDTIKQTRQPHLRKKVSQFDLQGNYIRTFKSLKEASKHIWGTENKASYISAVLIGKQKSAGGYVFARA